MELKQVQDFYAHSAQRNVNVAFDYLARHRPRMRHPLGECLDARRRSLTAMFSQLASELSNKVFSWTVMVS
jgi:hypothetical protein